MKNIILLITFTLLMTSCGGDSKSVKSIIESNDLTKIRKKRDDLAAKQNDLNNNIKMIDAKIKSLDTIKKYPLVTAFKVKQKRFDHYLELQGSVATKQNLILKKLLELCFLTCLAPLGFHVIVPVPPKRLSVLFVDSFGTPIKIQQ